MAYTSSNNVNTHELRFLPREHGFYANARDVTTNRSGSAPPSMEGSFAAIKNLIVQQNSSLEGGFVSSSNTKSFEYEEQVRANQSYLACYLPNINLNPRLPQPLIDQENQPLVHHIGDARKLNSFDDIHCKSWLSSQGPLSSHREEPDDERLSRQVSGEWAGMDTGLFPKQSTTSMGARHKSLVDLIQEEFPRTPSPIYSQAHSSNHAAAMEEAEEHNVHGNSLHGPPPSSCKVHEYGSTIAGVSSDPPLNIDSNVSMLNTDLSSQIPNPSSSDVIGNLRHDFQGDSNFKDTHLDTTVHNANTLVSLPEKQHTQIPNFPLHHVNAQGQSIPQLQGIKSQMVTQRVRKSDNHFVNLSQDQSNQSSVELKPFLRTSGVATQVCSNRSADLTSGKFFYSNLQPSSLFPPQYSMGGFAFSSPFFPPSITGYLPSPMPLVFQNCPVPSFIPHPLGLSNGVSLAPGIDMQHLYKFYGELGLPLQQPFSDPLSMHYFRHSSEDIYRASAVRFDHIAMMRGVDMIGSEGSYVPQKEFSLASYLAEQQSHYPRSSDPSTKKIGATGLSVYGNSFSTDFLMQRPISSISNPLLLPASQVSGTTFSVRKNQKLKFPLAHNRNLGTYSGCQGQSVTGKDDKLKHSFLEELKSSKTCRFEFSDVAGRIVEFSADQHGSRFIQQKLENCSINEKSSVFDEVLPHAQSLMTDVFGNYVIQKFFEHGSTEQRKELANHLKGRILPLSLQMYGCRVIQKALEVIELDQKTELVLELDGHVMQCVHDQNGNHVIQKCIECVPMDTIWFIIDAFRSQVATMSTHPYGCRVIQRILEHRTDDKRTQFIVDEILESAGSLALDQYGNYVTQHVLEKGIPHERGQILKKLAGQVVQMSQHKFASNVIEKCLEYGDYSERDLLIEEIIGQTEENDNLLVMMKDQFANYVIQKVLNTCTDMQREVLLNRMRLHLQALKKFTYGKHIVARVERLSGEGDHVSEEGSRHKRAL